MDLVAREVEIREKNALLGREERKKLCGARARARARARVRANVRTTIGAGARKALGYGASLRVVNDLVAERVLGVVLVRGTGLENVGEVSIIGVFGALRLTLEVVKKAE